jgi:hypothetical protein
MMEDDRVVPGLKCDVEMDLTGPNDATLNKWAADALRRLADLIESDSLQDGHHDLKDNVGKVIGTVYIDYYGERTQIDP